jgi:hypothetical protein
MSVAEVAAATRPSARPPSESIVARLAQFYVGRPGPGRPPSHWDMSTGASLLRARAFRESRASLACRVGLGGLRVSGRPAAQFMILILGRGRRSRYEVRGPRVPGSEWTRAFRVIQASSACCISHCELWRRPTG